MKIFRPFKVGNKSFRVLNVSDEFTNLVKPLVDEKLLIEITKEKIEYGEDLYQRMYSRYEGLDKKTMQKLYNIIEQDKKELENETN